MSDGIRTYQGRTLAELLPRIREELGDDAVVLRRREGLQGGVGGFFAKAFIEVEARAGGPRIDVRDEDPAEVARALPTPPAAPAAPAVPALPELHEPPAPQPAAFARLLADAYAGGFAQEPEPDPFVPDFPVATAAPAPQVPDHVPRELEREAMPQLAAAENQATAAAAPVPAEPVPATPVARPRAAEAVHEALVAGGCSPAFAASVVAEVTSHGLPFAAPRSLRRLARAELARRVPIAPQRGPRAVVALVGAAGAGRTTAAGRLAAAYAEGSDLRTVAIALRAPDGGAELRALVPPGAATAVKDAAEARGVADAAGPHALVVLDVPAVAPRDGAGIEALRRELKGAGVTEVQLVLPVTTGAAAARALLEALRPLRPAGLVLTHADEAEGAGAALELAAREGLPIAWQATAASLEPGDPHALAAAVLT